MGNFVLTLMSLLFVVNGIKVGSSQLNVPPVQIDLPPAQTNLSANVDIKTLVCDVLKIRDILKDECERNDVEWKGNRDMLLQSLQNISPEQIGLPPGSSFSEINKTVVCDRLKQLCGKEDMVSPDEESPATEEETNSEEETATQEEETTTQEEETATQEEETVTQEEETATQEEETAFQVEETATQEEETTTQEEETATQVEETATQVEETATPEEETATPEEETATQEEETATQEEETQAPVEDLKWDYRGENGPKNWKKLGYDDCDRGNQSPIYIRKKDLRNKNKTIEEIKFYGYDTEIKGATLTNNGRTVRLEVPGENKPHIGHGGLGINDGRCEFTNLHFHFGDNPGNGAENRFDYITNNRVMEMQIEHTKAKGGKVLLSVFFNAEGEEDNEEYRPIIDSLSQVLYKGKRTTIAEPIVLKKLLPPNVDICIRYVGTLSNPPCTKASWSLFETPIVISPRQIEEFRKLYKTSEEDENPEFLLGNSRGMQPYNGRFIQKIYGKPVED